MINDNLSYLTSSEHVGPGHPDSLSDQVAASILDACLEQDPDSRVACEVLVKDDKVILAGEITTNAIIDKQAVVEKTIKVAGYDYKPQIIDLLTQQSSEISGAVAREDGAGDQGCVRKGALVRTQMGLVPIEDIKVGTHEVLTLDGFKPVLNSQKTGIKNLVQIKLASGKTLDLTPDHLVLTFNGKTTAWKQAGNLTSGKDYVCCNNPSSVLPKDNTVDDHLAYLMGLLAGDGSYTTPKTIVLCNIDKSLVHYVRSILISSNDIDPKHIKEHDNNIVVNSTTFRKKLFNLGLTYTKVPNKYVPTSILRSSKSTIISYLSGLFDADSIPEKKDVATYKLTLKARSLRLLQEVQLLLSELGIYSSIKSGYILSLIGQDSIKNFSKTISSYIESKRLSMPDFDSNNSITSNPNQWFPYFLKSESSDYATVVYPFRIEKVIAVISLDKSDDVYDLTIQDQHLFNVNGMYVHNCINGYATNETPTMMPLESYLSKMFVNQLVYNRLQQKMPWLGPDCKTQVTLERSRLNDKPVHVDSVVISTMHTNPLDELRDAIRNILVVYAIEKLPGNIACLFDDNTKYYINQAGEWTYGGPWADCGVTSRKLVVFGYGANIPIGGGGIVGKDCTKVDSCAAYMTRYIAKNIVANNIADSAFVQLSYVIGKAEPLSFRVQTKNLRYFKSESELEKRLVSLVGLTPKAISDKLQLRNPIYRPTTRHGHFGNNPYTQYHDILGRHIDYFTWEKTNLIII